MFKYYFSLTYRWTQAKTGFCQKNPPSRESAIRGLLEAHAQQKRRDAAEQEQQSKN
jgi:hypothetical protein